jgi:hypothetical protein
MCTALEKMPASTPTKQLLANIESNPSNPENQLMYTYNRNEAQRVMLQRARIVHQSEYRHMDCPEELDTLQLLCQYLHAHVNTELADLIEQVFNEMNMSHLLILPQPSSSPSQ